MPCCNIESCEYGRNQYFIDNQTMQPIYKALAKPNDETNIFAKRVSWFSQLAAFAYQPSKYKKITMYYESETEYLI